MNRRNARRLVVACIVLLAVTLPAIAQSPPGLKVLDFQSRYVSEWRSSKGAMSDAASDVIYTPASFELSAVFRNTGVKAITSVSWEFLFFSDAQHTQVMLRNKFRDARRLAPGGDVHLKRISLRGAATEYKAVRITRIVYADGSVWKAKAGK